MNHRTLLAMLAAFGVASCVAPTTPEPSPAPPPLARSADAARPPAGPPIAPVREVRDTYFGREVVDPYRWMEGDSPEFSTWMKAQADHSRVELDKLGPLSAFRARVQELDNAAAQANLAIRVGGKLFYLAAAVGSNTFKLYVRDAIDAPERLLFDPDTLAAPGKHGSIDYYSPSPEGRYVAFGLSESGSEMSVLRIVEVATGKLHGDVIDRARFARPAWLDEKSFLYRRSRKLPPDAPANELFVRARLHVHELGRDPEQEPPVFGHGVSPDIALPEDSFPTASAPPGPYVVAMDEPGTQPEIGVYVARKTELRGDKTPWRKIVARDDQVFSCVVQGDDLYLLSRQGAPRSKLLRVKLPAADLAKASVVIPEGDVVLRSMAAAADALYLRALDGGIGRLLRVPYSANAKPEQVEIPGGGSLNLITTDRKSAGALALVSSWTNAPKTYEFDPKARTLNETQLSPPSPVSFDDVVAYQMKAVSADGTKVPLTVVHRKDLARDGSNPTWLRGYGAYGTVWTPGFEPMNLAWLERGGVVAICHPRGGGEYGDGWHRGGQLATKPNTIADFLACAHHLVDEKLTSPAHLAGEGTSAGGILIGGAITAEPELFGAAVIRVGMTNALRFEEIPIGPFNTSEFGSVKTEEGFRMLLAIDAFQRVKDDTPYPAVLLTTGISDSRVSPWQSAKMAARLQAATSSGKPVMLRVDYESGHGFGTSRSQRQLELADEFAFLWTQLERQ